MKDGREICFAGGEAVGGGVRRGGHLVRNGWGQWGNAGTRRGRGWG